MTKHIILGLKDKKLNEKLEAETKQFISDYTLESLRDLTKLKRYFKPNSIAISGDLKRDPRLVKDLISFRKDPDTESVNIVLFVGEVVTSDVVIIKDIGKLIDAGIYPVLKVPDYDDVKSGLEFTPSMTDELQEIYDKYTELQSEENKKKKIPEDDEQTASKVLFEYKPAKIIGFSEGKSGSGKKFILTNFVATLAKNNPDQQIAILDFDNSDSSLRDYLGIDEEDSKMSYLIRSLRSYTTQSRLKDSDSKADKDKLKNRLANAVDNSLIPVNSLDNVFAIVHTDKDSEKITDLTSTDIETLLDMIQDECDMVIFNLSYEMLNKKSLADLWNKLDLIYSMITMDKRDININLKLKQKYDAQVFNKIHYVLNKYEDKNYNEELDRQSTTTLVFDKDLLNMYGFDVTNIIPYVEPNILYNESFSGVFLANETTRETQYPRTAFELLVKDSGNKVPTLD